MRQSKSSFLYSPLAVLLCFNLLLSLLLPFCLAQPYVPQVPVLTSCPAGFSLFSVGDSNVTDFATHAEGSTMTSLYIQTYNFTNTLANAQLTQLSFGLLDNSALTTVVHLRLGVFARTGTTTTVTLVGQTDEISLYPSSDQILYANLQSPVTLLAGVSYSLAVWSDATLYTAGTATSTVANAIYPTYGYSPATFPQYASQVLAYLYPYRPIAGSGCVPTTNAFTAPGVSLYSFCAYTQSYTQAPTIEGDYGYTPIVQTALYGGYLAVRSNAVGSNSQGSYYQVVAATGNQQIVITGGFSTVYSQASYTHAFILGNYAGSNNYLYLNNPAATLVDSAGIALSFSSGAATAVVLRYTGNNSQPLETLDTTGMRINTIYSGFTLAPYTYGNPVPACTTPFAQYTPDSNTCPSGTFSQTFGDVNIADLGTGYNVEGSTFNYGNTIYFRSFTCTTPSTTVYQLSFDLNQNLNKIINLRMGLFKVNTPSGNLNVQPYFTLLSQTRQLNLVNPNDTTVVLNLLNPVTLAQGQNYSIAIWSDTFIYAPYSGWLSAPAYILVNYNQYSASPSDGGKFPATVSPMTTYPVRALGAKACVAASTQTVAFCATFVTSTQIRTYSGLLTVLSTTASNSLGSYYVVIGGSGSQVITTLTGTPISNYPWTVQSFNFPSNNFLYVPSAANGQAVVDGYGLQLVVAGNGATATAVLIWSFDGTNYRESTQAYTTTVMTALTNLASSVTYTISGSAPSSCPVPSYSIPANIVSPVSVAKTACASLGNRFAATFGDANVFDYGSHLEGNSISANTIYTDSFTGVAGNTITQVSIGVLSNTAAVVAIQMAIYDGTSGALLGQTSQTVLNQVMDQTIVINLQSAITLSSTGKFYIALITNASLNIGTATGVTSPSMTATYSASGMQSSFTATTSNGVIPAIAALGCATATHAFCSYFQYYAPYEATVTMMWQGLLQASPSASNTAFGTGYQVYSAGGHLTTYTRTIIAAAYSTSFTTFTMNTNPAYGTRYIYPSGAAAAIDGSGLPFVVASNGAAATLYWNAANKMVQDTSVNISSTSSLIQSNFILTSLAANNGIPSCSIQILPQGAPVFPPINSCPAGSSSVIYGDDLQVDYAYNAEGYYVTTYDLIYLRSFTTGAQATMVYQMGYATNVNYGMVGKVQLGIYTVDYQLIGSSEMLLINPIDQIFIANFSSGIYLEPNTIYNLALLSEYQLYSGFGGQWGPTLAYDYAPLPNKIYLAYTGSNVRPVAAYACTTATRSAVSSSSSTAVAGGGGNTNAGNGGSSSLSNGGIAGVVIGCVIGTNLILLLCLALCCWGGKLGGGADKANQKQRFQDTSDPSSKVTDGNAVEMAQGHAETA